MPKKYDIERVLPAQSKASIGIMFAQVLSFGRTRAAMVMTPENGLEYGIYVMLIGKHAMDRHSALLHDMAREAGREQEANNNQLEIGPDHSLSFLWQWMVDNQLHFAWMPFEMSGTKCLGVAFYGTELCRGFADRLTDAGIHTSIDEDENT